jgi:Na+/alanine symporter
LFRIIYQLRRLDIEVTEQSNSIPMLAAGKHGITGLVIHLVGFVLAFVGEGLVLQGVIGIESGIAVLVPFADLLYGLGLVMVVAIAARAGCPTKVLGYSRSGNCNRPILQISCP